MSLPSLQAVLDTGSPVVACARPWARDLLAGFRLDGFVAMKGHWRQDRAAVSAYKKQARHIHAKGLLLPDSLSSALVFKFAGVPSAGYRDDGRSLILRWPINKPDARLHAVQSWRHLTCTALSRWNLPAPPELSAKGLGLKLTQKHHVQALETLNNAGLKAGQFILIAPTATGLHHGKAKVWPHFDQLTRSLQNRGRTVVMCPPPSEITQAKQNAPTALVLAPVDL
ncbi:MAG: glycosyltransferase family 9 protein, partial [Burkholderiaceae bacterium]